MLFLAQGNRRVGETKYEALNTRHDSWLDQNSLWPWLLMTLSFYELRIMPNQRHKFHRRTSFRQSLEEDREGYHRVKPKK